MNPFLEDVKKYARKYYDTYGWDFVVEAMSDEEITEIIGRSRTLGGALRKLEKVTRMLDEKRREVQSA
jgi:hypothetical protein